MRVYAAKVFICHPLNIHRRVGYAHAFDRNKNFVFISYWRILVNNVTTGKTDVCDEDIYNIIGA